MSPVASGRFWSYALLGRGSCFALAGLGLVAGYLYWAVIERMGEPDQSLIYWYLPLLFMGLLAAVPGCGVGAIGVVRLRR